jgi:hypothetical protein
MRWPPQYKKIILENGDETAIHTAGKGGLQIGSVQASPRGSDDAPDKDLGFWSEGLRDIDFEL